MFVDMCNNVDLCNNLDKFKFLVWGIGSQTWPPRITRGINLTK